LHVGDVGTSEEEEEEEEVEAMRMQKPQQNTLAHLSRG